MKPSAIAKTTAQAAFEPFEALTRQVAKPLIEEAAAELGGFFGSPRGLGSGPRSIAAEELKRAREEQRLEELNNQDQKHSEESAQHVRSQYREHGAKEGKEQKELQEQFVELQSEVVKLAKAAGVETKAHLETKPKKLGILDIKRLTSIVRFLRIKAEESKSAKELVNERANAKPPTGMLAWVSGKQMKVHEQGTLQLQG